MMKAWANMNKHWYQFTEYDLHNTCMDVATVRSMKQFELNKFKKAEIKCLRGLNILHVEGLFRDDPRVVFHNSLAMF